MYIVTPIIHCSIISPQCIHAPPSLAATATVHVRPLQVCVEPRSHLVLLVGMLLLLLWWRWMLLLLLWVLEAQIHVWAEVWEVWWSVHLSSSVITALLTAYLQPLHGITALVILRIITSCYTAWAALLVRLGIIRQTHQVIVTQARGLK